MEQASQAVGQKDVISTMPEGRTKGLLPGPPSRPGRAGQVSVRARARVRGRCQSCAVIWVGRHAGCLPARCPAG